MPITSATAAASTKSMLDEQYSLSSSSSQFFMKMPTTLALLFEQVGGDGGVHAAGEADDNALFGKVIAPIVALMAAPPLRGAFQAGAGAGRRRSRPGRGPIPCPGTAPRRLAAAPHPAPAGARLPIPRMVTVHRMGPLGRDAGHFAVADCLAQALGQQEDSGGFDVQGHDQEFLAPRRQMRSPLRAVACSTWATRPKPGRPSGGRGCR